MFDILIKVLIYASWAGLILTPTSLLGLRLYYLLLTSKGNLKTKLLTVLLPFSIGIEYYVPQSRFKKTYRLVSIIGFVLLFLMSLFLFICIRQIKNP